jgi:DegV family protein with EDD domain
MAQVLVMTDSVSGISPELSAKYGVMVIPAVNININGRLYLDGVDITAEEAYRLIKENPDRFAANTLSPGYLLDRYREVRQKTDAAVFITFSGVLSATNKIAGIAADLIKQESPPMDVRVIDSKTAAGAQGLLAIAAAKAARDGLNLEQVVKFIAESRPRVKGVMLLDTLRYVYRTGRMSKTSALLASLLRIKPINRITPDGKFEVVDKVTRRPEGYKKLIELIKKEADTESLHFMVSHASSPEIAKEFVHLLKANFHCLSLEITEYSPIMGYASGPRCLFVGFHPELKIDVS